MLTRRRPGVDFRGTWFWLYVRAVVDLLISLSFAAGPYCNWSSISDRAFLILNAFLISSAVTYGYSPYSIKLGHWWSRTNLMNASGFVFQSIGNPSRFSKTVLMPVFVKRAIASSVYLSKSVSKIPWYMNLVSLSKSTQRFRQSVPVTADRLCPPWLDVRDDREPITRRRLGKDWAVFPLFEVVGLF